MKNIFVVTRGDYSDYRICAVFTEKELAEKYVNSFKEDDWSKPRIEIYSLNPYEHQLKNNYKPFFLRMQKDGTCTEIYVKDSSYGFESEELNIGFDIHKNMHISIFAKDEKHAIKIANEKRVQLIATNQWKE